MRIAIAQIDSVIGDFSGNLDRIFSRIQEASLAGADLVVFPELALIGYPPKDLLERPDFIQAADTALDNLCQRLKASSIPSACILGTISPNLSGSGKPLHNSAVFIESGRIRARIHKRLLPTYDVFDEARYFAPGERSEPIDFKGLRIGITVCEDVWSSVEGCSWCESYGEDPVADLGSLGADLFINISASPFSVGKRSLREELFRDAASRWARPFLFCNAVGGQDCLVFDGSSFLVDERGGVAARAREFQEDLLLLDMSSLPGPLAAWSQEDEAQILAALELALSGYMKKCGISKVALGLSGGIDSALTAAIAARALGSDRVLGVLMPSVYTSKESLEDAEELADNLGIDRITIPIADLVEAYEKGLEGAFSRLGPSPFERDVTFENVQARIRGNLLMAISNRYGHMVLATGNKSELAVGYCTLYGDMTGGYALIADLPKTMVYRVARHLNTLSPVIPERIFEKPPSAELRPGQRDQDDLPPYDLLDPVLELYLEAKLGLEDIVARGFDPDTVARIITMVERNEYKRYQAAPGPKITSKAFCCGRRYPIAQRFTSSRLRKLSSEA